MEKKSLLDRLIDSVKGYFGPLPILSGLLGYGTAGMAAFTIYAMYTGSDSAINLLTSRNVDLISLLYDIPETVAKIYTESRVFASHWSTPGFVLGQFLGYKLRKTVRSWFKRK